VPASNAERTASGRLDSERGRSDLAERAAADPALPARWTASIPPVRALAQDVAQLAPLAGELRDAAR